MKTKTEAELTAAERIAFNQYKKDIEKRLLEFNSKEETEWWITEGYGQDLLNYWSDGWEPNAVATGMEMGML